MAKRKLSYLQSEYREFFRSKLKDYQVDSPAQLTKELKSQFFTEIKRDWSIIKPQLITKNKKTKILSKKDRYSNVKGGKSSKTLSYDEKPKTDHTVNSLVTELLEDTNTVALLSRKNPDQTDDLRINFNPNQFFEQDDHYQYPVVKMPKEGSLLKLPREGRAMNKGFKEQAFMNAIVSNFRELEIADNLHLTIPYYNKPYEPDIVLIDRELNLFIDVEIDEPYDGYYRFPTHEYQLNDQNKYSKRDDIRDLFFVESGWVVIRFTEKQVHLQELECISLIKDVLDSIKNYTLTQSSNCNIEEQWDYQTSVRWQKNNYREKYLGIEKFGKQKPSVELKVETDDLDEIEQHLNRTKIVSQSSVQDNIAFEEETHTYHNKYNPTGNADYISVTTIIDRFFPFDLDRFIEKKAIKEGRTEKEVLDEFEKNRNEAAEKGTFLHEQIENFLLGNPYDSSTKEFLLFKSFYEDIIVSKGFVFEAAEKKILLEKYNIAGTVDAIFKKPDKSEYIIVDWKRSKKLVIDGYPKKYGYGNANSELNHLDNSSYYKYALQQNIYKYILETEYGMPISSMNLIVLHENYDRYHRVNLVNMEKEVAIILNSINHKI